MIGFCGEFCCSVLLVRIQYDEAWTYGFVILLFDAYLCYMHLLIKRKCRIYYDLFVSKNYMYFKQNAIKTIDFSAKDLR